MATQYAIYALKNVITGQSYVGKSKQPEIRRERHFNDLLLGNHHSSKLQTAFNAYGELAFQWKLLQVNIHEADSSKWEIFWIAALDAFHNGYNMNDGTYNSKPPIACSWNNKTYISLRAAAADLGVVVSTIAYRIGRGWTCDADIPKTSNPKPVVWENTEYPSIRAAARALGISQPAMKQRVKKGYTSDEDLGRKSKAA